MLFNKLPAEFKQTFIRCIIAKLLTSGEDFFLRCICALDTIKLILIE